MDRIASHRMFLSVGFALAGAMAMGTVSGWSGAALEGLKKNDSIPMIRVMTRMDGVRFTVPEHLEYETWISSSITLAALIGSLIAGFVFQTIGRRRTMIIVGVPMIGGYVCICLAKSFSMVIIGRSLTGFAEGIISSTLPGYITEFSTPKTRGYLGAGFQILLCVGILYQITFGTILEWKQLSYVSIVPMAVCSIGMIFAAESPIRLVERGNIDQARDCLRQIRAKNSDIDQELQELVERVQKNQTKSSSSTGFSMLKRPDVYHPLFIANMLMLFRQFSGINAVMFYLNTIFEDAMTMNTKMSSILVESALVLATIASAFMVDRFGRKPLLIASGLGQVISLGFMGYYYKVIAPQSTWIPVGCVILFVVTFSLGMGPIPWMLVGELTPNEAMPLVSSLGGSANWLWAFVTTKEFKFLIELVNQYGAYWFFGGFNLLSVLYTVFFVPETKNRSIEQMQRYFIGR